MRRRAPLLGEALPSRDAAPLVALVEWLERSQWRSAGEIAAGQRAQLGRLAAHHAAYSSGFAKRLRAAGLTAGEVADGLERLPPHDRRALQRADEEVHARFLPEGHGGFATASTSGSTGEPVRVRRTGVSRIDWQAMLVRNHLWHTAEPGLRFAALRGAVAAEGEAADWGAEVRPFFETGALRVLSNGRPIDESADALEKFGPDILLTYPSTLDGLIRRGTHGKPLSLRQVRTFGETLSPTARAAAEAHFSCKVVDSYSSEEVGHIASECPDAPGSYHLMDEMLIVEILRDSGERATPGEEGRVVLTDLRNFATALIRYDIGDRAVAGGPCRCGRGLGTIARILGRTRDLILMPDGSRHWPLLGRDGLRDAGPVTQFQIVQTGRETIEARLATEAPLTPGQESAIRAILHRALGHPFAVTIAAQREPLPRGPTGKFIEFIGLG